MVEGPMLMLILFLAIAFIVLMTAKLRMNAFLVLLITALGTALATGMGPIRGIRVTLDGFGGLISNVGVVIISGTIIGTFLEKSRATLTMANFVLSLISKTKTALAMTLTGVITSCTVFCDSGFIIFSPLNKVLSKKADISLTTMTVSLSLGLAISHHMIPPAAGPIAAAANIGADLGLVILFGFLTAIPAVIVVYFWSKWIGNKVYTEADVDISAEQEQDVELPPVLRSFLPILVPILLISLRSIANMPSTPFGEGNVKIMFDSLGIPSIAMLIGVFFAFRLIPRWSVEYINGWVNEGIRNSALTLAITAAGGAFGNVLRDSQIGNYLGQTLAQFNIGIFLPFIIASALKIAQGSGTVSLITASAIVGPMLGDLGFNTPAEQALVVTAIGAGAIVMSHANDRWPAVRVYRLVWLHGPGHRRRGACHVRQLLPCRVHRQSELRHDLLGCGHAGHPAPRCHRRCV